MSTTFVPRILAEHGVEQYFETLTMSSVCGIRKPRADIFDIALKEMGIPKEEAGLRRRHDLARRARHPKRRLAPDDPDR